mmetsp:Transcript_21975/g.44706  ORF Transcript_21975/g.44706 Transcript_21975/m.44706 type:complete len:436 (-) Transcript_21975:379-1686(-)
MRGEKQNMLATMSELAATLPDLNARSISSSPSPAPHGPPLPGVPISPIMSPTPRLGVPRPLPPKLPGCIRKSSSSTPCDPNDRAASLAPNTASASMPGPVETFKLQGRRRAEKEEARLSFPSGVGALLSSSSSSRRRSASSPHGRNSSASMSVARPKWLKLLVSSSTAISSSSAASCSTRRLPPPGPSSNASNRRTALPGSAEDGVLGMTGDGCGCVITVEVLRFLAASASASSILAATSVGLASPLSTTRRSVEFQRFLMALSVRPGRSLAISAQRCPNRPCASMSRASSSAVHLSFLTLGSSWLCHRSRICFPFRPGISAASDAHAIGFPGTLNLATSFVTSSSSSLVHGHFTPALLRRSCSAASLFMKSVAAVSKVWFGRSRPSFCMSIMLLSFMASIKRAMILSWRSLKPSRCVSCVTGMSMSSLMLVLPA